MIKCRLKIICSNIINDIDTPKIKYISQHDNLKISYQNIEDEINKEIEDNNLNISHKDKLEERNNNDNNDLKIGDEYNLEQNNNKIDQLDQIEELINNELKNYNKIDNNNYKLNDYKNIDSNELYTISNQHIYDDNYYSANISNYNTISHAKQETKNNSLNTSDSKKEHNLALKYVFRKRDKKHYVNRSLSNKHSNDEKNKKYSLIKDIFKAHPVNYNYTDLKILNGNKNKNKVGNILNININKSFCINNNIKINHKNIIQRDSKNKSKKISKEKSSTKNNKIKTKIEIKKEEKDILKNVKPLKFNKRTNKNKLPNSLTNSVSWNIVENNETNIEQTLDYKILIDELLTKECELIKEKENIIKTYEEKLKPLRELNHKLINENNEELDREDELRGELVILKNQHEKYFSSVDQEMKELNDKLNKGEILLVTKPVKLIKIKEKEEKNIILMLKGLFYSIHMRDTDKIVNLIWKSDKQVQTIYFLANELLKTINLKREEQNLLINFFYSFCKKHNYMDKTTFKKEFKAKIGNIPLYNKKILISKLMNFKDSKWMNLIKLMKEKDSFNSGILTLEQINTLLNSISLLTDSIKDLDEAYEFIIFTMKKDRSLNISEEENLKNNIKHEDIIKYSLFDLFYESLLDLIEESNYKKISNPFQLIGNYMQKKEIKDAEFILKPFLISKYIIKINSKEYFDINILNKYLRKIGIIQVNEFLDINCFEEDLVDKNKFINDIHDYGINENKET